MATVNKNAAKSFYMLALARICLGCLFLWAFFDKLFGLGFSTCRDTATNAVHVACGAAWMRGGSPTTGFLSHATGPFAHWYGNLAGHSWVDYLFMAALLAVGVGLLLGIFMRLATLVGIGLLILMWAALLWPAANPVFDEHIVYIFVLAALNLANSQQKWGLRGWWASTDLVKFLPLFE
ncbi:MAG TPA: hypothetical protein VFP32_00090 [Candidatus Saccharimonadales bacterium]|nr:hypothetical protein [Candidatus Saccharimonadales bacterium]